MAELASGSSHAASQAVPDVCPTCGHPAVGTTDEAMNEATNGAALRGQVRLAAIARAASSVADAGSLSVTLDVVAREVVQDAHIAAVQILRVVGGKMRVLGKAGFTDAEDFPERLEECRKLGARMMFVEAFRTKRRVVILHRRASVLADPAWGPLHTIMSAPEWDSFVAVPLVVRGRAVGVLNAFYAMGEDPGPETLEFLEAMADQAAMAVDSAELLARSRQDVRLEERARLARELHDSVVQQVFSMRMQAKALRAQVTNTGVTSSDKVRSVADELLNLAQNALADLRSLVLQLHPVELVGQGLVAAVRVHAQSLRASSGLWIDVQADELPELATELQEDLYRIVQEALHNVVKHAGARRATVRIRHEGIAPGAKILLEVCDDGTGLDPDRPKAGALGLVSMRERAQHWGGTAEIGNLARGCRVRVRVPAARSDMARSAPREPDGLDGAR